MLNEGGTGDHNDTVDIVFQSVQKTIDVTDADGKITKTQVMDDLSLWCKTLMVGSNTLRQTIFEMMEFMRNGFLAYTNMPKERAELWVGEVQEIVESVKKTLDSKSSESIRNKENSQSTLIDKINKNSVEKIYTMKETAKKSLWDSIIGKEKDKMSDE